MDGLFAALLLTAAVVVRLQGLGDLRVDFDSIDPFMRAMACLTDCELLVRGESSMGPAQAVWPATGPWVYHFGPALVWMYIPFVVGAESLQEAFARRYVLQALGVVFTYVSMRWLLQRPRRTSSNRSVWPAILGAWTAALVVGFAGEPFGTLGYGDQTYLAADLCLLMSVAVAMVLLRQRHTWLVVGSFALPWAVNMHPLALCYLPGLLLAAVHVWRAGRARVVAASLAIGLVCSLPQAVHLGLVLVETLQSGSDSGAAFHSSSSVWILGTAVAAFGSLEPRPLGPLLLAAPPFVLVWIGIARGPRARGRESRGAIWLSVWSLVTTAGLLALILVLGYHRPYHWRIPLPALALVSGLAVFLPAQALQRRLAGVGAAARWGVPAIVTALVAVLSLAMVTARLDRFPPGQGDLTLHRWMARVIQEDAGDETRFYDSIVIGWDLRTYSEAFMPAVYVEHRMMNVPRSAIRGEGLLYVAVNGPSRFIDPVRDEMGWDVGAEPLLVRPELDAADIERWNRASFPTGMWAPAIPGDFATDVALLGHYIVDREYSLLLVRFTDPGAARAWTGWLHQRFTREETPRLMLDCNYVLDLTTPRKPPAAWLYWFDQELMQEWPGVFSRDLVEIPPEALEVLPPPGGVEEP